MSRKRCEMSSKILTNRCSQKQDTSSIFPFLSLPFEVRSQIYVYLQAPKTFYGSPLTTWFDAQVYPPPAVSITLVNKQIRDEASAALHSKHTAWAFKVTAFTQGLWDTETRLRALARRMKWIKSIDLRFEHVANGLYHLLHGANGFLSQADSARCQICERHDFYETPDFLGIQANLKTFCETFSQMPALRIVKVGWREKSSVSSACVHSSQRCLLGCDYPGGVPALQDLADYQAMLTKMPEWVQRALANRDAVIPDPCPMTGMTREERKIHYWKQVKTVQDVASRVLEPLLVLPGNCNVERGEISIHTSTFRTRIAGRVHVVERGFANALDRVIAMRNNKDETGSLTKAIEED